MYRANIIDNFKDQYYFLSNFYNAKVYYKGILYLNNESAFQAQKDPSRAKEFMNLEPNKAKSLGRKVKLRPDWEEVKINIMKDIVFNKFVQNDDLKTKLINTGKKKLVEGNWWNDMFWGVCKGLGRNELGKILMNTRNQLKNKS